MTDWNALYKVSLGLYVLGAKDGNRPVGSIVDAVMVAANKPCALTISCNNASFTKTCIEKTGLFSLSVLPKDIEPSVIANFGFQSSKNVDKWNKVEHSELNGLPVLTNATAHITAKVIHSYPLESNTVFIAEVIDAVNLQDIPNLLYSDYRNGIKNDVIASFQQPVKEKKMAKQWVCSVCNYVYDGDIPFENLPEDYVCPICGVDKSFFEQRDEE